MILLTQTVELVAFSNEISTGLVEIGNYAVYSTILLFFILIVVLFKSSN